MTQPDVVITVRRDPEGNDFGIWIEDRQVGTFHSAGFDAELVADWLRDSWSELEEWFSDWLLPPGG